MREPHEGTQELLSGGDRLGILGLAGICPKPVQEQMLDLLANKATAVMTNVPGPQQPLYLAGARLESIMFWVPQSGDIGMGVSILSYNGRVQFGLITDAGSSRTPKRSSRGSGPNSSGCCSPS